MAGIDQNLELASDDAKKAREILDSASSEAEALRGLGYAILAHTGATVANATAEDDQATALRGIRKTIRDKADLFAQILAPPKGE